MFPYKVPDSGSSSLWLTRNDPAAVTGRLRPLPPGLDSADRPAGFLPARAACSGLDSPKPAASRRRKEQREEEIAVGATAAAACATQGAGGTTARSSSGFEGHQSHRAGWPRRPRVEWAPISMTAYHKGVIQQLSRNAGI